MACVANLTKNNKLACTTRMPTAVNQDLILEERKPDDGVFEIRVLD